MGENVIFTPEEKSLPPQANKTQAKGVLVEVDEDNKSFKTSGTKLFIKILIGAVVILALIVILVKITPWKYKVGGEVTLEWWGLWESQIIMQPLIDDFEKQNPNIKIKYVKKDPADRYRDLLVTRINNNSGPDIFRYHNTWAPVLFSILAPLPKDVISSEEFKNEYYPVVQQDLTQNGAIYGIPIGIDSLALFVNTDLLRAAGVEIPKDWNQFMADAKKMTVKDKKTDKILTAGAALGTYGNIMHSPDIISMMLLQKGVDVKKIFQAADNLRDVLTFYTAFAKGDDNVWDNTLDNSETVFAKGNLAMYFGFSWDIFAIEQLKAKNLKYEIYPVPALAGEKSVTVASYWVEGVSSRSKNQKEAMKFIRYLAQKETLDKFYTQAAKTRLFGEPYPRMDMADKLKDNTLIYPFVSQLTSAGSSYFASNTYDSDTGLNKRANDYLENAVNSMILNNTSAESAVAGLQTGVAEVLKQYGIH